MKVQPLAGTQQNTLAKLLTLRSPDEVRWEMQHHPAT